MALAFLTLMHDELFLPLKEVHATNPPPPSPLPLFLSLSLTHTHQVLRISIESTDSELRDMLFIALPTAAAGMLPPTPKDGDASHAIPGWQVLSSNVSTAVHVYTGLSQTFHQLTAMLTIRRLSTYFIRFIFGQGALVFMSILVLLYVTGAL